MKNGRYKMKTENNVVIFRKYLLPYSETFIAAQGGRLSRYNPIYVGFKNDYSGQEMIKNDPKIILEDFSRISELGKIKFRMGFPNKKFISGIESYSPSIIHAHFLKDGIDSLVLRKKLSVPLVTTLHGHDISKSKNTSLSASKRSDFFKTVDKVIVVSNYIRDKALEKGCPEDKIITHYIGIDVDRFSMSKNETDQPEILFVGRLVEKKGCIYLLQAMKVLNVKYPELKLTIVGEGPLYPELNSYVQQENLNVEFVGRENSDQIIKRLSRAWMFVAPSITAKDGDAEGLAMVFLEAQAMKTPVVTFDSGGISQGVKNGVTGFMHKEKDVDGLIESIGYFLDNQEERKAFGERGRARVEDKFDVKKQCLLLEDIYDSVR